MENTETPTRPATPSPMSAEDLYWSSTTPMIEDEPLTLNPDLLPEPASPGPSSSFPTVSAPRSCERRRAIAAGESRCAICLLKVPPALGSLSVKHFNKCWDKLREAAVTDPAGRRVGLLPSSPPPEAPPEEVEVASELPLNTCVFCCTDLSDWDPVEAFEHRIICQPHELHHCPRCNEVFTQANTAEEITSHLHFCGNPSFPPSSFSTTRHAWYTRLSARKNPQNCALCTTPLTHLDAMNAFHHRELCVQKHNPSHCPVCFDTLSPPSEHWSHRDSLWHVHSCQTDCADSVIARDDFEHVQMRMHGRLQCSRRLFSLTKFDPMIGPRKKWTAHDHQGSFRKKRKQGRSKDDGMYCIDTSPLRMSSSHLDGGAVRVVRNKKSVRLMWAGIEAFRTTPFEVYKAPIGAKLYRGLGSSYVVEDIVYNWPHDNTRTETKTHRKHQRSSSAPLQATASSSRDSTMETTVLHPSQTTAPWNTVFPTPTRAIDGEERGRSRHRSRHDSMRSRTSSHERRRHRAVDKACKGGFRIPPGFELRAAAPALEMLTGREGGDGGVGVDGEVCEEEVEEVCEGEDEPACGDGDSELAHLFY